MPITWNEKNGGKVLEVEMRGKLGDKDYRGFMLEFDRLVQQHGKLRVLFEMSDFQGWDAGGLWDEFKFDVKHFSHVERVAMVGDKQWQKGMSILCQIFIPTKFRHFSHAAMDDARNWIDSDVSL